MYKHTKDAKPTSPRKTRRNNAGLACALVAILASSIVAPTQEALAAQYQGSPVLRLEKVGAVAFLVGESLMRQADISQAVDRLLNR